MESPKIEPLLKLFVCEFITGGGLCAEALPASLVKEGALMRDALLADLIELDSYEIVTTHDARLVASPLVKSSLQVDSDFEDCFKNMLTQVDLVWLIAPESNGTLLKLSELCYEADVIFLGCEFDSTLIGTSKSLAYEALKEAQIFTIPTIAGDEFILDETFSAAQSLQTLSCSRWVAKPKDGAGCDGITVFDDLQKLMAWLKQDDRYLNYIIQPYQQGIAASLSMLCRAGKGWLLSCNEQHISFDSDTFSLNGVAVNGMQAYWQRFETLARKVAKMLPDAAGYMGIDVIVDVENDKIYVVEINPRLTTSYVGLREAIGHNPAKLILESIKDAKFTMPVLQRNMVEISL
ncbi:ATP-grasp domain-containing protein [Methylotenera sp.]|uniref:ATP-grasp domain-containing protein n=1 Tax=Methylotenera sp. TaxID=2051956 RepID=UPI0024882416|nr:ATP-grasp domain-containing protein [Methylotenera sp.]MDI1300076.1 ATP-grasp domain-containing protein [Methylotenera sp.]